LSILLFAFQILQRSLPLAILFSLITWPSFASASVGFQVTDTANLARFAGPPPRNSLPRAPWPPRTETSSHKILKTGYRLLEGKRMVVFVYKEIAGDVHGMPVVTSFSNFNKMWHKQVRSQLMTGGIGKKVNTRRSDREGLVDIKIPFRVPRGLSAITGGDETRLNITARQRLDLSGVSQFTDGEAQSSAIRNSKFPTIAFEQESQVNVNGEIGEKISVNLEQNSNRQLQLSESLRLRYDGDEDAIIRTIEAGNTNLTLPGTRLIGFQGGRGGLFGIKAEGTIGGLDLTLVTTQDKGSSNRKTFQGSAEESAHTVRDHQFMQNVYFFFDSSHRNAFPNDPRPDDQVDLSSVDVYINDFNEINDIEDRAVPGIAYTFWNNDGTPNDLGSRSVTDGLQEGSYHQIDRSQYLVDARGYLIMHGHRVSTGSALAVAYRTRDGRRFGDVGFIQGAGQSRIRLKLIKARNPRAESATWPLAWRNVYSLSGRDIEPSGFDLRIQKEVAGREPVDSEDGKPYIQIFGLDTHTNNSSASSPPDNLVDTDNGSNVPGLNLRLGHLVFPFLEPFGTGSLSADIDEGIPELYSESNSQTRAEKSKYIIQILSQSRATRFNLGAEILVDSEVVTLNNRRLEKGKDYTIDYSFGAISFIGNAGDLVSDPTANLKIDFSSKDPFGGFGQQKSLLGIRLEHPIQNRQSFVGMTLLYSNQTTAAQRVRVGEEPARTLIWDANARLQFKPTLLTDIVNAIPFVSSSAPSRLDLDVEVAQSIPNPNTKGVAYIDDFEGSQDELRFSILKNAWTQSSTPTRNGSPLSRDLVPRGRFTWYTPIDRDRTSLFDIQPNRTDLTPEQAIVDIMRIRFEPATTSGFPRGTQDPNNGVALPSWGGIVGNLDGWDLSRSKFLEIWIRGRAGKFHVDLGEISEKIDLTLDDPTHNPHPGRFRTEDEPLGGLPTGDGIATAEEDIGLDGLTDEEEAAVFRDIFPNQPVPQDPSGDNFADVDRSKDKNTENDLRYPPGINGTEDNNSERISLPNTEDLNSNGFLDTKNDYVRYSFDLFNDRGYNPETGLYDGPSVLVEGSESNRVGGGATNPPWRLVRIPLSGTRAPRTTEGTPDTTFTSPIDFVRFWVESDRRVDLSIFEPKAVGNDWLENDPSATSISGDFEIATIGTVNPIYVPPPGLDLERDPTTGNTLTEKSLALKFRDLFPGESLSASRTFVNGEDYTRYGKMSVFAHGGNNNLTSQEANRHFPAVEDTLSGIRSPVELFLRFSPAKDDTNHLYEYRSRVYKGWAIDTNTLDINLELMTQLKGQLIDFQSRGIATVDTTLLLNIGEVPASYFPDRDEIQATVKGHTYVVRGNPSLSRIKSFTLGVRNRGEMILDGESELWVDELTVDNIRKKKAISGLLSLRTVLADLGNFNLEVERRSGDFQDLQGAATGNTTSRLNLNTDVSLNKFLPSRWQTSIPLRYSYNRTSSVPRIRRGSDIVLTDLQKAVESDINSQSRLNITFRKTPAKEDPRILSRLLWEKVNGSLSLVSTSSVSGAITRRRSSAQDQLTGSVNYDMNIPQKQGLKPLAWFPLIKPIQDSEFFYLPSTLRYRLQFTRQLRDQQDFSAIAGDTLDVIRTDTESFNLNENYEIKFLPLRSLTTDYKISITRDLRQSLQFTGFQFGREIGRTQAVTAGFTPKIFRWLSTNVQYSTNYRENFETGGQRTPVGNSRRGLTVSSQNQASLRLGFNVPALFRPLTQKGSILKFIGTAGSALSGINTQVAQNKTFNTFGLTGRPSLAYQLGFSEDVNVPQFEAQSLTRTPTSNITDRADASTSMRLPMGLTIQSAVSFNHTSTAGNSNTEDRRITLPDLKFSMRGLQKRPVLRWLWTSANLTSNFQLSTTKRGEGGLDSLSITNDIEERKLSPMLSLSTRWKNGMSTTVQTNRTQSTDLRYQRNVQADEEGNFPSLEERTIGTTISNTSNLRAQLRYSIKPKIFESLQSNIDLDLTFQMSDNQQVERPRIVAEPEPGEEPQDEIIRRDESTWSGQIGAQYRFSESFTGGLSFRHERRKDILRELTNMTYEFRLFGEIEFN
jgi:hypothetical protein